MPCIIYDTVGTRGLKQVERVIEQTQTESSSVPFCVILAVIGCTLNIGTVHKPMCFVQLDPKKTDKCCQTLS